MLRVVSMNNLRSNLVCTLVGSGEGEGRREEGRNGESEIWVGVGRE
jgi:hypothetical protein